MESRPFCGRKRASVESLSSLTEDGIANEIQSPAKLATAAQRVDSARGLEPRSRLGACACWLAAMGVGRAPPRRRIPL